MGCGIAVSHDPTSVQHNPTYPTVLLGPRNARQHTHSRARFRGTIRLEPSSPIPRPTILVTDVPDGSRGSVRIIAANGGMRMILTPQCAGVPPNPVYANSPSTGLFNSCKFGLRRLSGYSSGSSGEFRAVYHYRLHATKYIK